MVQQRKAPGTKRLGSATVRATITPERVGWVETPTFIEIESAFVLARELPSMAVVYGAPGVGKTSAIKRYSNRDSKCRFLNDLEVVCKSGGK